MRKKYAALSLVTTLALFGTATPSTAGIVGTFWGPAWLEASSNSEYLSDSGLSLSRFAAPPTLYLDSPATPGFVAGSPQSLRAETALRTAPPDGYAAGVKDMAAGRSLVSYTVGADTAADVFSFDFGGTVSNVDSWLTVDKPADWAKVQLTGRVFFEISQNSGDRTGFWFGDRVGTLTLNPLRAAQAYESFSLKLIENGLSSFGSVLLAQAPGDPGASVDLYFGNHYSLLLSYEMAVPFGIDPPFTLSVSGSVSAVPEPGASWLWLAGLGLLGMALPRQRPAVG